MSENLARQRFMILNLLRLSGIAMVLFGVLIIAGKVDLPAGAGYVLFAVGLVDALIAPPLLARRWRTPPQ
jgi:hypothetical protein